MEDVGVELQRAAHGARRAARRRMSPRRGTSSRRRASSSRATSSTRASATWRSSRTRTATSSCSTAGTRPVIDVTRVDYIRVPVDDIDAAKHFYGEVLGLSPQPESRTADDWVEYEAVERDARRHDAAHARLRVRAAAAERRSRSACPTSPRRRRSSRRHGVEVGEMWDSGVCNGAGLTDPAGNRILLHHRYAPYEHELTHSPRTSGCRSRTRPRSTGASPTSPASIPGLFAVAGSGPVESGDQCSISTWPG